MDFPQPPIVTQPHTPVMAWLHPPHVTQLHAPVVARLHPPHVTQPHAPVVARLHPPYMTSSRAPDVAQPHAPATTVGTSVDERLTDLQTCSIDFEVFYMELGYEILKGFYMLLDLRHTPKSAQTD